MRIRCPSCSATYEVADALLDPPRTVRCARCAHDWIGVAVAGDPVAVSPAPAAEPIPEPVPEPAAEAPAREPVVHEIAKPVPEAPEPEPVLGDTPLSAIERLAAQDDLSPPVRRRDRILTAAWAASFALL